MAHDVFISYASEDKPVADAVVAGLEREGIRCWYAPRDISSGTPYAQALIDALRHSRALVLVFSAHSNVSPYVTREVERAVHSEVPIVPFRIENVPMSADMEFFISLPHWLDAMSPPLSEHIGTLTVTLQRLLNRTPYTPGQDPVADLVLQHGEIEMHSRNIELAPDDPAGYLGRARVYIARRQLDRAAEDYRRAVELDVLPGSCWAIRAELAVELGLHVEAEEAASRAIEYNHADAVSLVNRAIARERLGRFEQAMVDCDQAIETAPDMAVAYTTRSMLLTRLQRHAEALADAEKAVGLAPNSVEARYRLAGAHGNLGHHDQALKGLNDCLSLDPSHGPSYADRGFAHFNLGDYDAAIPDLSKAIEIDPANFDAYANRGACHHNLGLSRLAIQDYETALGMEPNLPGVYNNLGMLAFQRGDTEAARQYFSKCVELGDQPEPTMWAQVSR